MLVTPMRLLIAIALTTPSVLPAVAQSDAGNTLRMVPHADLAIVDPYFSGVYITRNFGYLVYDTLFGMDRAFHPQPEMVDSWQASPDGLTYTFRLRDGLKFHDGQPVRAADAVASIKRWGQRNDAYGQALLAAATAIEVVDDSSFRIVLRGRFPVLEALATTTTPTPFIMPERLAQTDAYTQLSEVDGSGPFKFVKDQWQPGHKAVYVRNLDYVARAEPPNNTAGGKVARVDRIEWLISPKRRRRCRRSKPARSTMSKTRRTITRQRWRATQRFRCRAIPALSASSASTNSIHHSTTSRCVKRCSRSPISATT